MEFTARDHEDVTKLARVLLYTRSPVDPMDLERVTCACGKKVPAFHMRLLRSLRIGTFPDNVCKGCEKELDQYATVVCMRCKTTVARLAPHKDKFGFMFRSGRLYHVRHCPGCSGIDVLGSVILEQAEYQKKLGVDRTMGFA